MLRVKMRRSQEKAVIRRDRSRDFRHSGAIAPAEARIHHEGRVFAHDDADVWESNDRPDVIGHFDRFFGKQLVLKGRPGQSPRSEPGEQGKGGDYSAVYWRWPGERETILHKPNHGILCLGRTWAELC